jgi:hypothetical protein
MAQRIVKSPAERAMAVALVFFHSRARLAITGETSDMSFHRLPGSLPSSTANNASWYSWTARRARSRACDACASPGSHAGRPSRNRLNFPSQVHKSSRIFGLFYTESVFRYVYPPEAGEPFPGPLVDISKRIVLNSNAGNVLPP